MIPTVENISVVQAEKILQDHQLTPHIRKDSFYAKNFPPNIVLKQYPPATTKVKKHRKIYLTINPSVIPHVRMPNLYDNSLTHAKSILKNVGLSLGNITYVPDLAKDVVIRQMYQKESILPNTSIQMGESIDLVLGSGLNAQEILVPHLVGLSFTQAKTIIENADLTLGNVTYILYDTLKEKNLVSQQTPVHDTIVKVGTTVDIWVYCDSLEEEK